MSLLLLRAADEGAVVAALLRDAAVVDDGVGEERA